ncbi:aryl-alcohol dehydrogenase-like predicted oxidoreductase [Motilibacter peucedani]|uniref:Aryl-alcohol dehydrogenase-like predicted oxidoreductase n=1 Tax=Motilibacter peucedani TaxID=598650 RepID=A0A420XJY4_9ACTN|nr:aryl-alcohol dehydrogenase-like predicted oxidoreductase [Motilibacter peucedani]
MGRSGLRVSRLGLGTSTWGREVDELDASDLLRAFRDGGGTLLQTSPDDGAGAAESVVGALLAGAHAGADLVLASRSSAAAGRSRRGLLRGLDASLARLGTGAVDLWLLHGWSDDVPVDEALSAADAAVSSGRAAYVGLSGTTGWQAARAATLQEALHRTPLVAAEAEWSLVARRAEQELVPASTSLGLGVLAGAPLGRGVLTGKYRHGIPSDSRAASSGSGPELESLLHGRARSVTDAVATAADGLGTTPLAVSLGWLLARPGLSAGVVGARTPAQLRTSLAAEAAPELPPAIVSALDDVSAAPRA